MASAIADQDENTVGQRRLSLKWQGLDPSNREKERVLGKVVTNEERKCPMCGSTTWILLDGISTLQALEGGFQAVAYSCEECGFMRWHRADKADRA